MDIKIAILIDGDNAQASLLKEIIEEVSIYGKGTIRRIYGDWTDTSMNSWKNSLNEYSISPVQKFTYSSGKNSTDSALIIDAMDILHNNNVDGFCIVSSDSDYTGLAKRIREEGLFVMGIGRTTTPIAFQASCEIFTFTENLQPVKTDVAVPERESIGVKSKGKKKQDVDNKVSQKPESIKAEEIRPIGILSSENLSKIDRAFEIAAKDDDATLVSKAGSILRQIDPSFDHRTFGFKTLSKLFESLGKYQIVKIETNGFTHPLVRLISSDKLSN